MSRIAILPPEVADQIAAGEVVERPFSVVKELVENALDAGATSIDIRIDDGGRQTISVVDDGCGMTPAEALLALERHATSKIRSAHDLTGVRSFGFRGEALPAISSVSRLRLETAVEDGAGVVVSSHGGVVSIEAEVSRRRGTTVTVEGLFYNVPARLKFLRGARSEWRAIQETVVLLAMSRGDVRFRVEHDGKQAILLPSASSLRERAGQLWGAPFANRMLEVEDVSGAIHTSGLVERPADVGTATRRAQLLVNGRAVRDNGLLRAAEMAYRSTIPAGMRPSLLLSIVLPGDAVDVNVHPAKAEVRFRDRWSVERCVEAAVARALGTFDSGSVMHGPRRWFAPAPVRGAEFPSTSFDASAGVAIADLVNATVAVEADGAGAAPELPILTQAADESDDLIIPPLVQLRRTFMMFERDDGIVLIDQHSAHERVLYEEFLSTLSGGASPSQRLLFPLTLHLGSAEADAFEENRQLLEQLGFEVEGFGGNTLLVRAVPMPHPRFDAEHCLRDTLAALTGDRVPSSAGRHERLAATVACKAAVKAGDQLTQQEMRSLFRSLASTRLPAHDVHGRAVVVHLPWEEVERRFGRR